MSAMRESHAQQLQGVVDMFVSRLEAFSPLQHRQQVYQYQGAQHQSQAGDFPGRAQYRAVSPAEQGRGGHRYLGEVGGGVSREEAREGMRERGELHDDDIGGQSEGEVSSNYTQDFDEVEGSMSIQDSMHSALSPAPHRSPAQTSIADEVSLEADISIGQAAGRRTPHASRSLSRPPNSISISGDMSSRGDVSVPDAIEDSEVIQTLLHSTDTPP